MRQDRALSRGAQARCFLVRAETQIGGDIGSIVQAVAGVIGTIMTLYGRARATMPLVRRDMRYGSDGPRRGKGVHGGFTGMV